MRTRNTRTITEESYLYGYDDTVKMHPSGLFLIKGQNKVLISKLPIGVKEIKILDEHANELPIQGKVFTFNTWKQNILLVETENEDFYEFYYDGMEFVER